MNTWELLATLALIVMVALVAVYAFASTGWNAECRGMCRSRGFSDGELAGFELKAVFSDGSVTCRCEAWELMELDDVR